MAEGQASLRPWHALEIEEALREVVGTRKGLGSEEAAARRLRYGANRLPPPRRRSAIVRLAAQVNDVLIYVLLAAALATGLLREWADVAVILAVVIVNSVIGFVQEGKAERALDAIGGMLPRRATVRRDGRTVDVDAVDLVPGDVVELGAGDKVPADIRLFRSHNLRTDEGILTGESVPVEKSDGAVAPGADLGARRGMAFSGTLVTYGRGLGVVVATGEATEIGRISGLVSGVQTLTTPFLRQLARLGRWLSAAVLAIAAVTVGFGVFVRHLPAMEVFLAGVGLAVAAIPEGLPAIVTVTLAAGVRRMARRNAIIRRLPAVETLGSVAVICSDKTGTLTRNEMTVRSVVTAEGEFEVGGVGYDPHGGFIRGAEEVAPESEGSLLEIARAGMLCNDARAVEIADRTSFAGDPTEIALLVLAAKAGRDLHGESEEFPRDDAIPFESERRFMATLHHDHAGHGFVIVKGAPEAVLERCAHQRRRGEDFPLDPDFWHGAMHRLAHNGERLLALAFGTTGAGSELTLEAIAGGLTLLGVVGMIDPPREEAIRAVTDCHAAGIRVKMITGDHAVTAVAIGRQMGIGNGERVLTGRELDALDEEAMAEAVRDTDVFARASPEHKLKLVTALQAQGYVVAMTGDGVNDAPALKRADIGIAMGERGTDVAKETAPMVLADDNFATIAAAVREGRTVYDNLKKAVLFMLPTNGAEALVVISAIVMGTLLPITPLQILWVNTITAVTLALPIAFEPAEPGVMARPPRGRGQSLLTLQVVWRIVFVSFLGLAGTMGLFEWERMHGGSLAAARTVVTNTLVMVEMFYLLNTRLLTGPLLSRRGLTGNRYIPVAVALLLAAQVAFVYGEPLHELFGTAPLGAGAWLRSLGVGVAVLLAVEGEKTLIRRLARRRLP